MKISDKIREMIKKYLNIQNSYVSSFDITRRLNYESNAAKNTIWFNGDSYELSQLFGQLDNNNNSFWGSTQTKGLEIRKMHSGLPKLLVNTLANITVSDLNEFDFKDEKVKELIDNVLEENNFKSLVKDATKNVLAVGDGAFKISFSKEISELPIIEFYSGEDVDYVYKRGRLVEVRFYNKYKENGSNYVLEERYGYGYVKYNLYKNEQPVAINSLIETEGIEDVVFDESVMLAVPYKIFNSEEYKGRGDSIYDGKDDAFDALDEVISQWIDALRAGRVKTYIPDSLIPKDPSNGASLVPNAFDNKFIKIGSSMNENDKNEITTVQPNIQVEAYVQTYITELDICLQGLISPSTLGIDVKKLDNAESQREKEKTTMYTRNTIIYTLSIVLKNLVQTIVNANNIQNNNAIEDVEVEISFGEYANPSFEAVIETMSNPNTPMSIEAKVDELWGTSKTDRWKAEEVARIKSERGIMTVDEPGFSASYDEEAY